MTTLRTVRRPMLHVNMTTDELIREAEFVFQNPTPLIAAMIARLDGRAIEEAAASTQQQALPLHCPACGAELQIEDN